MRLFIALELTDAARDRVARALGKAKKHSPDSKWVPPENLHITLAFLGSIPDEQVPSLSAALEEVAARHPALSLKVGGGGTFGGKKRPRVLWVGAEGDREAVTALFADVEEAMTAFGYEKENRAFHPHVTLARARAPRGDEGLAAAAEELQKLEPTAMHVGHVALVKSVLGPGGAKYEVIQRAKLQPRSA